MVPPSLTPQRAVIRQHQVWLGEARVAVVHRITPGRARPHGWLRDCEAKQAGPAGREAPVNHVALDSDVLLWFMAGLTLLLLVVIVAVLRAPAETAGSPQPPEPARLPPPLLAPAPLAGWPLPVALVGAAARPGCPDSRPRHAGAAKPGLIAVGWPQASDGPPWGPAPLPPGLPGTLVPPPRALADHGPGKASAYPTRQPDPSRLPHAGGRSCPAEMTSPEPGLLRSAPTGRRHARPGGRPGAHRRGSRRGAHRADPSIGHARGSAGRAGRHRAGAH
jgi:hypothetical protein